jgi:hypothetical protein
MLDVQHLYIHNKSLDSEVLAEVRAKFPNAEEHIVPSHWNIPELHQNEDLISRWAHVKRKYLVVGHKSRFTFDENGRSTDFIGPSVANGCAMACTYCVEEGTLISTPKGSVAVETLQEDDPVLAYDSSSEQLVSARVWAVASRDVEEVIELEVDGRTLVVSLEHPMLTQRGWVEAQYLTEDDEVLCE